MRKMIVGNKIVVLLPYQQAYSWDTDTPIAKSGRDTQTHVFVSVLEERNATKPMHIYTGGNSIA